MKATHQETNRADPFIIGIRTARTWRPCRPRFRSVQATRRPATNSLPAPEIGESDPTKCCYRVQTSANEPQRAMPC